MENGQGILPVQAHMAANQNGKRPATDIPLEAKKPAVGDGAKYGKPYWLAELEKVKEKWGTGVSANKSAGESQKGVENRSQGGPSNEGKAPLWMGTGKGGFINMYGHGDRRIVELGPSGEPINQ